MADGGACFKKSAKIEISTDEEGFRGAWFPGTVVKPPTKTGNSKKVVVDYDTLVSEKDETKPLRETIDLVNLRPPPPRETLAVPFQVSDEVDAWHNDAWWEGIVIEVMEGASKYLVFFRASKEQHVFVRSELRLHREWIRDGIWNPPLEGEAIQDGEKMEVEERETSTKVGETSAKEGDTSTKKRKRNKKVSAEVITYIKGSLVEVRSDEDGFVGAWFEATVVELLGKDRYLAEYKTLRTDDDKEFLKEEIHASHMRPPPPEVQVDKFRMYEEVDALHNDGWWIGVICNVAGDSKYAVYFKESNETLEFKQEELRQHWEWVDGEWVNMSQDLMKSD